MLKRLLVGSPIRQKPRILREWLTSLEELERKSYTLNGVFIDDNDTAESSRILKDFVRNHPGFTLIAAPRDDSRYLCTETTHQWKESQIWKVASFKDQIIRHAKEGNYDYLFLIDSDLVLHPRTLERMIETERDIVSNIFWTKWTPNYIPLPQVWVSDHYTLFERGMTEQITEEEAARRQQAFLDQLSQPGTYSVGGLGACTLLSKNALQKNISFERISNISFWGEDRHFCVRAQVLGLSLHVDTCYPAFHIYRESDLDDVPEYKRRCKESQITLSMVVRNEEGRYLKQVLESARKYISSAVIIDDASTDASSEICQEMLKGIPLTLIRNTRSKFSQEASLRKQQWEETVQTNPHWILALDADEQFEKRAEQEMLRLAASPHGDAYCFRLYDLWNETHYRADRYWCAHENYRPFMIRYKKGMSAQWNNRAQHCGRLPFIALFQPLRSDLRLKHYGWAKPEDRLTKYRRYQELDPGAKYGWKEQYESILDPQPTLFPWTE